MTDIPVIFSGPMVRALLEGRKTMTRRLASSPLRKCAPGDRLYVRENWRADDFAPDDAARTIYMADANPGALAETRGIIKWRPCIHMPRVRSRLTLIVTATKVERLQDISDADAIAEGWPHDLAKRSPLNPPSENRPRFWFAGLWLNLHGQESWDANPFVVAITFRAIRANIDAPEARAAA